LSPAAELKAPEGTSSSTVGELVAASRRFAGKSQQKEKAIAKSKGRFKKYTCDISKIYGFWGGSIFLQVSHRRRISQYNSVSIDIPCKDKKRLDPNPIPLPSKSGIPARQNEKRQPKLPFFIEYFWLISLRNSKTTTFHHAIIACGSLVCGHCILPT
jgi:hypothetical protein